MGRVGIGVVISLALLGSFLQAPAVSAVEPAPQTAPYLIVESFGSMPAWDDVYNAPWNSGNTQISWTLEPAAGAADNSGNTSYLRGFRNEHGSSVLIRRFTVPQNTDIYVGVWMRCPSNYDPSPGVNYWMESGFKMGAWGGQNFDDPATGASWFPIIQKFEYDPAGGNPNGNGNVWTWYVSAAPKNSGAETTVSVGFKLGTLYSATFQPPAPGPDVGWDGIAVSDQPMTVPPMPPPGPPPPGPPPGGEGGGITPVGNGDNDNGDSSFNDRCGCSTVGLLDPLWLFPLSFFFFFFFAKMRD